MKITLTDFYAMVRTAHGRGTSLDALLPRFVEQACLWMERNNSMKYMEREGDVLLAADSTFPDTMVLPNCRVKAVRWVRTLVGSDAACTSWNYFRKLDPREQRSDRMETFPRGYWQSGHSTIRISGPVEEDTTFSVGWYQYTDWPTEDNDGECAHWLIVNAHDLMLAQTMIQLAPVLRDKGLLDTWGPVRDQALKTLVQADEEADELDMESVMLYGGGHG